MDIGEIEEKLKDISRQIGYASGVIVGLHSNKVRPIIDELIAEVKRLREELDERYLCPECGYTWSVEDDERLEGMIEDREGE